MICKARKQAFTLIEMLVVIVIIGILLAIVIPSVSAIISNRSKKLYKTHMELVEKATTLYADQYKGELLADDTSCFLINYTNLLNDNLIKEDEIKCEGYIVLEKSGNNKSLNSSYYLTCVDKDNNKLSNSNNVPTGCKGFNGKFKMEYAIYKDSNHTIAYDGTEYVKDAYLVLNAKSPYNVPISYYEYNLGTDGNWTKIESNINLSTIDNLKNYTGSIHIRAVDQEMNTSTDKVLNIKMDNDGPNFNTNTTGSYLEKEMTINDVKDNGIGLLADNPYSFDGGNTWVNYSSNKYVEDTTVNVCVKDKLNNINCKQVIISGIDRVAPTINAKASETKILNTDSNKVTDYFNIKYGNSGGNTVCKVGTKVVNNVNELTLGINTVTCTATGNNGLTSSATTKFIHQYYADSKCSQGKLDNKKTTCSYSVKTGTTTNTTYTCPSGYTRNGTTCTKSTTTTVAATTGTKCTKRSTTDCETCSSSAKRLINPNGTSAECKNKTSLNNCGTNCCTIYSCTTNSTTGKIQVYQQVKTCTKWRCTKTETTYSCPSGYTLNGTTCSTTTTSSVPATATTTTTDNYETRYVIPTYSCPTTGTNTSTNTTVSPELGTVSCPGNKCSSVPLCTFKEN
ncbi:MAG: type II secretion system GspH family protein [Tenericutes bacterium]|nr:type II secretion system GspH family protein [Mycoplasmatota bacterium]